MSEIQIGSLVRAVAGKEAGKYYVILKAESEYVYLSDGKRRKAELPKKKKLKHIAFVGYYDKCITEECLSGNRITNKMVKRAISDYLKQIDNN